MKKILAIVLCGSLLMTMALAVTSAGNAQMVTGLQENLDVLWLKSSNNGELFKTLTDLYSEFLEDRISAIMGYPDYAKEKMGLKLGDDDYIVKQIRDMYALDFDKGFLLTDLIGNQYTDEGYPNPNMLGAKYSKEYANTSSFHYLLLGEKHWAIPYKNRYGCVYFNAHDNSIEGERIIPSSILLEFIFDSVVINQSLNEAKIQQVDDIKVFTFPNYDTLIYICSDSDEYVLRFPSSNAEYEALQHSYFKANIFCNVKDAMNGMIAIGNLEGYVPIEVNVNKPKYEEEGASLMSAGIIQGNEKGLDLLKPLTRLEATALIVRVLGLEDEPTSTHSEFVDIPDNTWGVKYANIAKDHGISYGVGDEKFAPDDLVSSAQFSSFVLRAAGEPDFNWETATNLLIEKGIITAEDAKTMDLFTRGDMAKIIYEAREKGLLD